MASCFKSAFMDLGLPTEWLAQSVFIKLCETSYHPAVHSELSTSRVHPSVQHRFLLGIDRLGGTT